MTSCELNKYMQNLFITPHDHLEWISEINKVKNKDDGFLGANSSAFYSSHPDIMHANNDQRSV